MKNILSGLIIICLFTNCYGNRPLVCIDNEILSGFFVVIYEKSEVEHSLENQLLKNDGKTYEKIIDFEKKHIFIPVYNTENNLVKAIKDWNPFNQKEVYFLSVSPQSRAYLEKFCPEKADSMIITKLESTDAFYELPGDEKHLYKIYFIEGLDIKLELKNNESNKIKLDLSDEIDRKEKVFYAHFIYNIIQIKESEALNGFKYWEYRPNK